MKNIIRFEKYDGQSDLAVNVMYTGKEFNINGKYDLEVYGQGKLNGSLVSGRIRGYGIVNLVLNQNASVVFWNLPREKRHPEYEPVPDPPEYQDEATQHINFLIAKYMEKMGINIDIDNNDGMSDELDLDQDLDDDDDFDIPIDDFSLVDLSAKRRDAETPDSIESGELEQTVEIQENNDENVPDSVEESGLPSEAHVNG